MLAKATASGDSCGNAASVVRLPWRLRGRLALRAAVCQCPPMLRLVYVVAIGTWFGAVVSLSFVVAPTAHGEFPAHEARRFLRPLFPRHYTLGVVCGFVALAAVALGKGSLPYADLLRLGLPAAAALVCTLVARDVLVPRMRSLSGDDPRFARLHQASAMLNSATLGALALALAGAVMR